MKPNIELVEANMIKNILYLKFNGICGIGSEGNNDSAFILNSCKKNINQNNQSQGLVLDFSNLNYEFGNGFAYLFLPNERIFQKKIFISIISNSFSLPHWKSLIENINFPVEFYGYENSIFQDNLEASINSINRRIDKNS